MRSARSSVVVSKPKPWGTIAAVLVVVLFAGGVFGYAYYKWDAKRDKEAELAAYTPSETNKDPSDKIQGVVKVDYNKARGHVIATQRVAYDRFPPFGGPHDGVWADCNGVVYNDPVRNENMVHPLEHGAVWIAYNPDQVTGSALDTLKAKVTGQTHMMLSPYPSLDKPISLQSWGHQLKVDTADDPRIDRFIRALRTNPYQYPEVGGTCDPTPGTWDNASPPPFVGTPPPADAVPMDFNVNPTSAAANTSAPAPSGTGGAAPTTRPTG
ncbi:MAG TPA: DUF3105 domain-containing protein [Pseudonocardiaceae bacterium]